MHYTLMFTRRIHVCYIYIYVWQQGSHQYTPFMLAYIPAPWILWVMTQKVPDQGIPAWRITRLHWPTAFQLWSVERDIYHLVMTNSLPWYRWPIEIDGLPINGMVISHGKPLNNQRVITISKIFQVHGISSWLFQSPINWWIFVSLSSWLSLVQGEDSLSKQLRELQHAKEEAAAQVAQSTSVVGSLKKPWVKRP